MTGSRSSQEPEAEPIPHHHRLRQRQPPIAAHPPNAARRGPRPTPPPLATTRSIADQLGIDVPPDPEASAPSGKPRDISTREVESWLQVFHDDPNSTIAPPNLPPRTTKPTRAATPWSPRLDRCPHRRSMPGSPSSARPINARRILSPTKPRPPQPARRGASAPSSPSTSRTSRPPQTMQHRSYQKKTWNCGVASSAMPS